MEEAIYLAMAIVCAAVLLVTLLLDTLFDFVDEALEVLGADIFPDGSFLKGYFSFKALLAFFAMTGAVGYTLNQYEFGGLTTFISAVIAGGIIGGLVGLVMQSMSKINSSTHLIDADFAGASGTITAGILEGGFGEVRTTVRGQLVYLSAKSEDGAPIHYGTTVEVVKKEGNVTIVRPTE